MEALLARLEAAVAKLESIGVASSPSASSSAREIQAPPTSSAREIQAPPTSSVLDPGISEYDELVEKSLGKALGAAEKIGGQVLESTRLLQDTFAAQRDLLLNFKKCKKPDPEGFKKMIQPLSERIIKANALTEGRRTQSFNHLKTVAESLTAVAWVTYTGKDCGMSLPGGYVEEVWEAAEFYNNKVLVEYKNKDSNHVEWAKAIKELYVPGLRDFVRKFYPRGPVWNTAGADSSIPVSATAVKSGARPAPPPPPPLPTFEPTEAAKSSKEGMSALFEEISRGESVTAGLKKVTADMKTKNRPDRSGAVTVAAGKDKNGTSGHSFSKTGPPKLELQMGRKWVVENQIGKKNLVIEDCDSKQSVYIFGCKDSVLLVKGKVNNITIDKCTKTGVVFTDVVSACEIVNCNRIEVQCQGTAPTIAIDNTSGCQLYLSKGSLDASITTAKSSEVNVLVPGASDDADMIEHSLPEQFNHTFKDGGFVTNAVSHSGG